MPIPTRSEIDRRGFRARQLISIARRNYGGQNTRIYQLLVWGFTRKEALAIARSRIYQGNLATWDILRNERVNQFAMFRRRGWDLMQIWHYFALADIFSEQNRNANPFYPKEVIVVKVSERFQELLYNSNVQETINLGMPLNIFDEPQFDLNEKRDLLRDLRLFVAINTGKRFEDIDIDLNEVMRLRTLRAR